MPAPLIPAAISIGAKLLPAIIAAGQAVGGAAARGRANQLAPPAQDPSIGQFLQEVRARRRSFETGAAFNPLVQQLRQREQGAIQAAGRHARTLGEFVTSAGRFRADTTRGLTTAFTRGQELAGQLFQQEGQIVGEQSQRTLELQLLEQGREEARAASRLQGASANALGFAARLGGGQPGAPITQGAQQGAQFSQADMQAGQQFINRLDQPPIAPGVAGGSAPFAQQPQVPSGGIPALGNVLSQLILGQGNKNSVAQTLGF